MQNSLVEPEREPGSPAAPTQPVTIEREFTVRFPYLRLCLYILQNALLFALTSIIFVNGVSIIHRNAKALGFFVLNFDVPMPFLLIGLWGIAVITFAVLLLATLTRTVRLLVQLLRRSAAMRQRAA